jgi:thimet oligopeptidase
MRRLTELMASALLMTAAGTAPAAPYKPSSDALIGPISLTPKGPADVTKQCDSRLAAIKAQQADLEALPLTTDPATLLAAYDDAYNLVNTTAYTEPSVLKDTHPDAAVRKAAEDCVQRAVAVATAFSMSRPIYERLKAVDAKGVAPELRYTVQRQLDNYRRSGVDRDDATRKRITELQEAITATTLEFERNIADDKRTVSARPEELVGLPQDYITAHAPDADGQVRITMAYPDVFPVSRYSKSADLRKRLRTAFQSRAYPAFDAVLSRLFTERAELASLLGYENYGEFDLANRMAQSPVRARAFLDDIAAAARPTAKADAARMLTRLQKDDPSVNSLGAWSTSYAAALIRKEDYAVDPQLIRQYLRYDKVEKGILTLVQDLFQVEIRPWQTPVWHPDVKAFELVERGQVIGRFYLDMHPREGKFTHAQMSPVRIGIQSRAVPVAVLECNFPQGLMEHSDVVVFLHEFGHLIHWLFAGQRPLAAQNFSEIENDVIEAPSQLLEEWVWDYPTLKTFATNDAGEPIPEDLVRKMNAGRRFAEAFGVMGQLGLSAVSLDYYSTDTRGKDLTGAYDTAYNRYALAPEPEGAHPQDSFGHLGGYGAAYYTYQWSKALASDLLSQFHATGLRDRATAQRYREQILAPGGSESMNTLARRFLGRDWSVDAYRRELELGSGSNAAAAP